MNYIYLVCLFVLIGYIFHVFRKDVRCGMVGLVFVSLVGAMALPYFMIPFRGVSTGLRVGLIFVPLVYVVNVRGLGPMFTAIAANRVFKSILYVGLFMAIGLVFSRGAAYGIEKIYQFIVFVVAPITALLALAPFRRREVHVMLSVTALSSVLMGAYILNWGDLEQARSGAYMYADYGLGSIFAAIGGARLVGFGVLILTLWAFLKESGERQFVILKVIILITVVPCLLFVMISTGSRGPAFALIIALACGFVFAGRIRLTVVFTTIGFVLVGGWILKVGDSGVLDKLLEYPGVARVVGGDESVAVMVEENVRWSLYEVAYHDFTSSSLMGKGTGGFSGADVLGEGYEYPHNMIMEFAAELGLVGLALFGFFLVRVFKSVLQARRHFGGSKELSIIFALFSFAAFNALVSGDIPGNNHFWIFATLPSLLNFAVQNSKERISGRRQGHGHLAPQHRKAGAPLGIY